MPMLFPFFNGFIRDRGFVKWRQSLIETDVDWDGGFCRFDEKTEAVHRLDQECTGPPPCP